MTKKQKHIEGKMAKEVYILYNFGCEITQKKGRKTFSYYANVNKNREKMSKF